MDKRIRLHQELFGRAGLINGSFGMSPLRQFMPKGLYSYVATGKNLHLQGCSTETLSAGSIDFSSHSAMQKCIGEYVERLFASIVDLSKSVKGSYQYLTSKGLNLLNPTLLRLYADWQYQDDDFPFKKLEHDDEIDWIKGYDYINKTEIYIPAFLVFIGYITDNKGNAFLHTTSTGNAASTDVDSAIASGFFEIIERHAFTDFWYNQSQKEFTTYSPDLIRQSFPCNEIERLYNNNRVQIKTFDIGENTPLEVIVVTIFFQYKGQSFFTLGSAARMNKKEAIVKACLEAYQGVDYAIFTYQKLGWKQFALEMLKDITDFDAHFNFYNAYPEKRVEVPFIKEAKKKSSTSGTIKEFKNKIHSFHAETLKENGFVNNLFYVDLSELHDMNLPLAVVKVISPDCALLTPNHNHPYLGNEIFGQPNELFLSLPHCFP